MVSADHERFCVGGHQESPPTPRTCVAARCIMSLQVTNPHESGLAVPLQTLAGALRVETGHGGQPSHGGQSSEPAALTSTYFAARSIPVALSKR